MTSPILSLGKCITVCECKYNAVIQLGMTLKCPWILILVKKSTNLNTRVIFSNICFGNILCSFIVKNFINEDKKKLE